MPLLLVVACPKCRKAKIVEQGRKTSACPVCGRSLDLAKLRVLHSTDSPDEARDAVGRLNAALAGRPDEYALAPPPPRRVATPRERALRALAELPAEVRIEEAARALGEFTEEDFAALLAEAGLPVAAAEAIRSLEARRLVFEPRAGRFRVVG